MVSDLDRIQEVEQLSFNVDAFSNKTFLKWHYLCSNLFIVGVVDRKIVGYMITYVKDRKGHVISIAVDPSFRKKGIGSELSNFTF